MPDEVRNLSTTRYYKYFIIRESFEKFRTFLHMNFGPEQECAISLIDGPRT